MSSKTKTFNHFVDLRQYVRSYDLNGAGGSSRFDGDGYYNVDTVTYEPYDLPGWRKQIADGLNATNKLVGVKVRENPGNTSSFGSAEYYNGGHPSFPIPSMYGVELSGYFGPWWLPGEPELDTTIASVNNQALMKLNAQVLKAQQSFQGFVFAGELAETIQMIRHPAQSLYRGVSSYLSSVKKRTAGKRYPPKTLRRIVSDSWLEYSFGWVPLLSDVNSGMKALAEYNTYRRDRVRLDASAENTVTLPNPYGFTADLFNFSLTYKNPCRKTTVSVRYTGAMSNITSSPMADWRHFGFDPRSVVPALWELVPYSFLVDYFSNVGSVIQSVCLDTSGVSWISKTVRSEVTEEHTVEFQGKGPFGTPKEYYSMVNVNRGRSGTYRGVSIVRVDRNRYEQSIVPRLEVKVPGTSLKWLNIAALVNARDGVLRSMR
jgi:hypothetical protein